MATRAGGSCSMRRIRLGRMMPSRSNGAAGRQRGGRHHNVVGLNALELFKIGVWRVAGSATSPGSSTTQGEEAHEDEGLNERVGAKRGAPEQILLDAEGCLDLRQLDVGLPQLFIAPVADVAVRPICRMTRSQLRRLLERAIPAARQTSAVSIRPLNLSCIAHSLLRRSAELPAPRPTLCNCSPRNATFRSRS
jgi:hypothetical protein